VAVSELTRTSAIYLFETVAPAVPRLPERSPPDPPLSFFLGGEPPDLVAAAAADPGGLARALARRKRASTVGSAPDPTMLPASASAR